MMRFPNFALMMLLELVLCISLRVVASNSLPQEELDHRREKSAPVTIGVAVQNNKGKKTTREDDITEDLIQKGIEMQSKSGEFDGYIVKFEKSKGSQVQSMVFSMGKSVDHIIPKLNALVLKKDECTEEMIKTLRENENVEYVEPNYKVYAFGVQQDERRLSEDVPYGIKMVQADQLDFHPTNKVKICVVDTGYALNHPDLPNTQHGVMGGQVKQDPWSSDGNGHGTHCAGTIGAIGGNNIGVVGVNDDPDNFEFIIGKSMDDNGQGDVAGVTEMVQFCMDNDANVISMSLGGGYLPTQIEYDTYEEAYDNGILIIAAAGNAGNSAYSYPASFPMVMSVGAVNNAEQWAGFSQFNDQVEISGPGVDILSTFPMAKGSYESLSGTSMATPHVAGVAAKVWSHFPDCSNNQIRNVLIKTAKEAGQDGCDVKYGNGIVQAKAAYDLLFEEGCEAGGVVSDPLSSVSTGGCMQGVPTPSPTPYSCENGKTLKFDITTDQYGSETTWKLTNGDNELIKEDGPYLNTAPECCSAFEYELCLPANDCYNLAIEDFYDDGMCCDYGEGSWSIQYDGVLVAEVTGDDASGFEVWDKNFGCGGNCAEVCPPSKPPTTSPVTSPLTPAPSPTPSKTSTISPVTSSPTSAPSPTPTKTPTASPVTSPPTSDPSPTPSKTSTTSPVTSHPTLAPSTTPSKTPTTSPVTSSPTSTPSTTPSKTLTTSPITSPPTPAPSPTPSKAPTTSPVTSPPTPAPSPTPSKTPTTSPVTSPPTPVPSPTPTQSPTLSPLNLNNGGNRISTPKCQLWCYEDNSPWIAKRGAIQKCNYKLSCSGCPECHMKCHTYCYGTSKAWSVMCARDYCRECNECLDDTEQ